MRPTTNAHVNVVVLAMKVLILLADGLRNDFSSVARNVASAVLAKAKEKRLCNDVNACLLSLCRYSLSSGTDSLAEDLSEGLRNKKLPSHARQAFCSFIAAAGRDSNIKVSIAPYEQALLPALILSSFFFFSFLSFSLSSLFFSFLFSFYSSFLFERSV